MTYDILQPYFLHDITIQGHSSVYKLGSLIISDLIVDGAEPTLFNVEEASSNCV
jgi:hypothetical protein